MRTLIVQCIFTVEIPWENDQDTEDQIQFRIEDNSCPGTGPVDGILSPLISTYKEESMCWACTLGGRNKLIEIVDRMPRNYLEEVKGW